MSLPFTVDQFFDVFAQYNAGVWPAQLVLNALAVLVVALVVQGQPSCGRWISATLALLWGWMAVAYHFVYFTSITPAAWAFGAVSLLGGLWFAWVGVVEQRLCFALERGAQAWAAGMLVVFALVIYPLSGYMLAHRYPAAPTFGLPCPTTIFTIGILLFAKPPLLRSVFIVPVLWAIVGSSAAFALDVHQDLGLLVAGVIAIVALARQAMERSRCADAVEPEQDGDDESRRDRPGRGVKNRRQDGRDQDQVA